MVSGNRLLPRARAHTVRLQLDKELQTTTEVWRTDAASVLRPVKRAGSRRGRLVRRGDQRSERETTPVIECARVPTVRFLHRVIYVFNFVPLSFEIYQFFLYDQASLVCPVKNSSYF